MIGLKRLCFVQHSTPALYLLKLDKGSIRMLGTIDSDLFYKGRIETAQFHPG